MIACPSIGKCHCHNNTWEGSLYRDYECHADAARWAAQREREREENILRGRMTFTQQLLTHVCMKSSVGEVETAIPTFNFAFTSIAHFLCQRITEHGACAETFRQQNVKYEAKLLIQNE